MAAILIHSDSFRGWLVRDFYDLAIAFKTNPFETKEILEILSQKELRKRLSKESILANMEVAEESRRTRSGSF